MLATGKAVLDYGGYLGFDAVISTDTVSEMVRARAVRYFWLVPAPAAQQEAGTVEGWVRGHCALEPARLWQPPRLYGSSGPQLFDCRAARAGV